MRVAVSSAAAAVLAIRYAMLCGRPPFETSTLKETYERIAASRYTIPSHVTPAARDLIGRLLSHYPHDRPSLSTILRHEFFTCGYMPTSLNVNCCYTAPKFPAFEAPTPRYLTFILIIIIVIIVIIIVALTNDVMKVAFMPSNIHGETFMEPSLNLFVIIV